MWYLVILALMLLLAMGQAYFGYYNDQPSFYISAAVCALCAIIVAIFIASSWIVRAIRSKHSD